MSKIGVFDSGIGGLAMVRAIETVLPEDEVVFVSDKEHMPYGDKSPVEVLGLVVPSLESLVRQGCEVLVIACNTVTTQHIDELRRRFTVPIVGMEPMIKPAAAATRTGVIAVCATPGTLASARYAWLKQHYAAGVTVLEPDCRDWAYMIEHNEVNEKRLARQINDACDQGADVIVLACTHYHWIEELLRRLAAGRAKVVQPEQAVVKQLRRVLAEAVAR
jgi:glutamate racemase